MNNKVEIKGNKIKVFEDYQDNDHLNILMILLIINYSTNKTTLSVPLKKIAFILNAVKKNIPISRISTQLSSPWSINGMLRKNIILSHEKKYVVLKDNNSSFGIGLDFQGKSIINEVEKHNLIPEIRNEIMEICKAVKTTELKKQILIW